MYKFLTILLFLTVCCQNASPQSLDKVLGLAKQRYGVYIRTHSDTIRYPRSTKPDGSLVETPAEDWTSGFFPGCLWYMYRLTTEQ